MLIQKDRGDTVSVVSVKLSFKLERSKALIFQGFFIFQGQPRKTSFTTPNLPHSFYTQRLLPGVKITPVYHDGKVWPPDRAEGAASSNISLRKVTNPAQSDRWSRRTHANLD